MPVLALVLALLAVATGWLGGHLPWVLDGFTLRTASFLDGSAAEGLDGVRILIPLVASELTRLVAFTTVGTVAAMLLPLAFPALFRGDAVAIVALTLAVTTLALTVAARSTIRSAAAGAFASDPRVLDGLLVGVFVVAAGAGIVGAMAAFQPGFLPLAAALVVGQLPLWLPDLLGSSAVGSTITPWVSLLVLTAAFAASVRRTVGWVVLWPLALALVWIATPLQLATGRMSDRLRGGTGLTSADLGDVFADAADLFAASFWSAPRTWWPGLVAAGLVLVWLVLVRLVRRRRLWAPVRPVREQSSL